MSPQHRHENRAGVVLKNVLNSLNWLDDIGENTEIMFVRKIIFLI